MTHDDVVFVGAMPVMECQFAVSRAEALAVERGDLDIVACRNCGHVFNRVFDPDRIAYTQGYENSREFSRRHRAQVDAVTASLIERYDLHGKTILEIGSGSGDFLRKICAAGGNRGIGYDPSQPDRPPTPAGRGSVEIVGSSFDDAAPSDVDMVCSQHVLEHLSQPVAMLKWAHEHLAAHGVGYFEVPNGATIFHDLNIWDFTYEHVSYFSQASLHRALSEADFPVCRIAATFGHQYLDAEAALDVQCIDAPAMETFENFPGLFVRTMAFWREQLTKWRRTRQKVVLWGAGTKAVSFLNMLGTHANDAIECVVDINPRKCDRYIPGSGHRIVLPELLRTFRPDWIVVMNSEYQKEIETQLRSLDVDSALVQSMPATSGST
jgi:SAM-dependent methyltransferase